MLTSLTSASSSHYGADKEQVGVTLPPPGSCTVVKCPPLPHSDPSEFLSIQVFRKECSRCPPEYSTHDGLWSVGSLLPSEAVSVIVAALLPLDDPHFHAPTRAVYSALFMHSEDSLVHGPKLFHIPPENQSQRPPDHRIMFITATTPCLVVTDPVWC